jgi:hypothetical protein
MVQGLHAAAGFGVWGLGFRVYAARADDDKTHLHREGVVAKHE